MSSSAQPYLSPDEILKAYTLGYFPMARSRDDESVVWVLPDFRGVLDLAKAAAPKRLLRTLRAEPFSVTRNKAFKEVIAACAESARGREETWINPMIETAYTELHVAGYAHSIECWRGDRLVGGLYGVSVGGVFCGESMFSRERDASKIAMLHLIARLKHAGYALLDTQFYTEHLAQFGVEEWTDANYQAALRAHLSERPDFCAGPDQFSTASVAQSITQTS